MLRDRERARQSRSTYLLGFSGPVEDPLFCVLPVLVEGEKASLAATFDKLIRLCDELGRLHPLGEVVVGRDGTRLGIPLDLSDLG